MAPKDDEGQIVETPGEATSAEHSPDTLVILIVSLVVSAAVSVGFAWYLGYLPPMFG